MHSTDNNTEIVIVSANSNMEKKLLKHLVGNPSIHAFTLNDIRRERGKTTLYAAVSGDDVYGYMLVYMVHRGYKSAILEIFNKGSEKIIIRKLLIHSDVARKDFIGTLHVDKRYSMIIKALVKPTTIYDYYIMEYCGSPPRCETEGKFAIIGINERVMSDYISTYEIARRIKGLRRAYGVILDGRIVGVGGFYVMEPEVYLIGGIYVEPEYRGRGIGKTISCFLTRKALEDTGRVALWVNTENAPAIRIYRGIGYRIIRVNAWVNVNVDVKP